MAWLWWQDFNKKMCGNWITNLQLNGQQVKLFISIDQDENGVTVKTDFDFALFLNDALYVEYSYDTLNFFHNDRIHRTEYTLALENDNLLKGKYSTNNCWGIDGHFETDIEFTRLTDEELVKYQYFITPKNAAKIDILKEYAEYGNIKTDTSFQFLFNERENMSDIIEKHNLDELVKGKTDAETAIALMNWLCQHYKHGNPPGGLPGQRTPQALMAAADEWGGRTNCRGLSLILAQLICAYDIKAFHITCSPYEEPFSDCHVVVCVYCQSLGKHIMLDPSANLYLRNNAGDIISVEKLRDILIADEEVTANDDRFTNVWQNLAQYRDYMAKNFIRIERYNTNGYGIDGADGRVVLLPEKYMQNEAKALDYGSKCQFITSRENFWQE